MTKAGSLKAVFNGQRSVRFKEPSVREAHDNGETGNGHRLSVAFVLAVLVWAIFFAALILAGGALPIAIGFFIFSIFSFCGVYHWLC
jgi:hypothetical protein